mgnify:CR=1 FL=1
MAYKSILASSNHQNSKEEQLINDNFLYSKLIKTASYQMILVTLLIFYIKSFIILKDSENCQFFTVIKSNDSIYLRINI